MRQGKSELIALLKDQLESLKFFGIEYDKGNYFLFKDIAVRLRVLFHHTNSSHALLKQLKLDHIEMYDSAYLIHDEATTACKGPIHINFDNTKPMRFHPNLLMGLFKNPYEFWWNEGAIIVNVQRQCFTRKEIVLFVTNKDGGAHIDAVLPGDYYDLSKGEAAGWSYTQNSIKHNLNPIPALIRQIAHEIILTFRYLDIETESKLPA